MRFVFDQKIMAGTYPAAAVFFLLDLIKKMAILAPADEFILLAFPYPPTANLLPANVSMVNPAESPTRFLGKGFQANFGLPRFVSKMQPAVFIGIDNPLIYRYPAPHALLLIDAPATEKGAANPAKLWLRSLSSATTVCSFISHPLAAGNTNFFKFPVPVPPWVMDMAWTEKENLKAQYASGYDYFLFSGDFHPRYLLLDLLKAFSLFKQWQGSAMHLVLAGPASSHKAAFVEKLKTYKFRDDVVIIDTPDEEELKRLMGAAYAFVYPSADDPLPVNVLQAISCGLPVITTDVPVIREWVGEAVRYVSGNAIEGFAAAMKEIFNDEAKRESLVDKANDLTSEDAESLPAKFLDVLRQAFERK